MLKHFGRLKNGTLGGAYSKSRTLLGQVAAGVQFGCDRTHRGGDAHSGKVSWPSCGRDCRITVQTGRCSAIISNVGLVVFLLTVFVWQTTRSRSISEKRSVDGSGCVRLKGAVLDCFCGGEGKTTLLVRCVECAKRRLDVTHWVCLRRG